MPMSTKSGHDLEPAQQAGGGKHHHHGDGQGKHHHGDGHGKHHHGDSHGKHHHGDHDHHHHHKDDGHKHPPLRDAVIKAGGKGDGGGGTTHGGPWGQGSPSHARPRASTLTRKDTSVGRHSEGQAPSIVELENTYKMVPDVRFQQTQVREIIATVLKENLTEPQYDPRVMSRRCLELSDVIKERVKQLDMRRFKIVCMVMIGQNTDQSLMVSSRCLWNFNFDNFSSFTLKKDHYYALGMVFATYTE